MRRKRKKKKPDRPWSLLQVLALSFGVHVALILIWVIVGRLGALPQPGQSAILVHEVVIGDAGDRKTDSEPEPEKRLRLGLRSGSKSESPSLSQSSLDSDSSIRSSSDSGSESSNSGSESGSRSNSISTGTGTGGNTGDPILAEIRRRIERTKRYPAHARAMHQEGRVGIQFRILPSGQIAEVQITHSSGIPTLDDAARDAVARSAPLPYYAGPIAFPLTFHLK